MLAGHQQQLFPPGTGPLDNYGSSPTIPSLLDMRVPYVPRGTEHIESPTQVVTPMNATGGSPVVDGNVAFQHSAMYAYPGGVQYGYPSQFAGMTQQYMPGYSAMGLVPSVPQYPMQVPADVIPQPLVAAVSPVVAVETKEKERKPPRKKKPEPLTVEELLNIPLPPKAKDAQKVEKKEDVVVDNKDDVKVATKMSTKHVDETKKTAASVVLPKVKSESPAVDRSDVSDIEVKSRHPEKAHKSKVKVEKVEEKTQLKDAQKSDVHHHRRTGSDRSPDIAKTSAETIVISDTSNGKTESVESDASGKREMPDETTVDSTATRNVDETARIDGEEPKVYHFAWDDVNPGCVSGVSSVHTSDLSSFDDGSDMVAWSSDDDVALKAREEVTITDDKPLVKPDVGTFNVISAKYCFYMHAIQYSIGYFQCRTQLTL